MQTKNSKSYPSESMPVRNNAIDFLRFLGLSLIICIHISPPYLISQVRAFDVCLMVFVSGLAASERNIKNYWKYIWKRTKRLVIPVWIFLTGYFGFLFLLQFLGGGNKIKHKADDDYWLLYVGFRNWLCVDISCFFAYNACYSITSKN